MTPLRVSSSPWPGRTTARLASALLLALALAWGVAEPAAAQTFEIPWFTIDGGGAMFTTDGQPNGFELSGTIGQLDAGPTMTGGGFELVGGFWPGAAAAEPCIGDLNGDGVVELTDLAILLAGFGCTGGGCPGDIDGDGDTDLADLAIMLSAFGTTCG